MYDDDDQVIIHYCPTCQEPICDFEYDRRGPKRVVELVSAQQSQIGKLRNVQQTLGRLAN